jgi:hypothetical protein
LVTVSKEAARRFLVSRQGFGQNRGTNGTLEAIKRLECVQIDPVRVIHRNQHLVLHNRVSDYKPSYLETLLYKERAVFEYWCNEKSIIPIEEFRYFRYRMQNYMEFHSPFYERLKAHREELENAIHHVLSVIDAEGPLCAEDFKKDRQVDSRTAKSALNLLWDCGEVMIHHVETDRRYYDLTERILPKDLKIEIPGRDEYERFMIEKYMKAYGLVDMRDWGFGWLSLKSAQRKKIVSEMEKNGEICPVKVEGVKDVYYTPEAYSKTLEASNESLIEEKVRFIAPLDNLIWNRRMISEIFDFDYAWEIYKIPEKRHYGYYVLPILYNARFVGRIDPKLDRINRAMIINSLLLEDEHLGKRFIYELAMALWDFLRFHDVSQIKIVKIEPKKLKNLLLAELNQFIS